MKRTDESVDDSGARVTDESVVAQHADEEPGAEDDVRVLLKRKLKAVHQQIIAPPGE